MPKKSSQELSPRLSKRIQLPRVSSVVLTWNTGELAVKAFQSLMESTCQTSVLHVDNNSADDTVQLIAKRFPTVECLQTGDNLGYAGGNNRGIERIISNFSDYIFILNPDAYVDKDCLQQLVDRMEQEPDLAVISPMIYHDGTHDVWFGGSQIVWRNGVTLQPGGKDVGQFDHLRYTNRANGCAMLVRVSAIDNIGLMDERFFLYYEETDWSVSFAKAGYKIGFEPKAKAWHKTSSSTGGFTSPLYQYYMARNKLLFVAKQRPGMVLSVLAFSIIDSILKLNAIRKKTNPKHTRLIARAIAKGYLDFMLGRFGKQRIPT